LGEDDGGAFELFGAAKYKADSWNDGIGMSGSETTYYDATSGAKLGSSGSNTQSNGDFQVDYRDADNEHLGDERRSSEVVEWNLKTIQTITEEPEWLDLNENGTVGETLTSAISVVVREGVSTTTDSLDEKVVSYKNYFSNDVQNKFLGGSETRNGETLLFTSDGQFKTEGKVIDGYISGALVFADMDQNLVHDWIDGNENGNWDPGEGEAWVRTNQNGEYNFTTNVVGSSLIAVGGIDTSTNENFDGALAALPGGSVITPLTSLIAQLVNQELIELNRAPSESEYTEFYDQATAKVMQAFNLANVDISNFDAFKVIQDPLSSETDIQTALNVQKAAAAVANIIVAVGQTGANTDDYVSLSNTVMVGLVTKISTLTISPLDLSDPTTITELVTSTLNSEQISSLIQANVAVLNSNNLHDLVAAQKQIQGLSNGSGGNTDGNGGTTGPTALNVVEADGIITITGTTPDAQGSNILVGYELDDGSDGVMSGVTVGGNPTSGFTVSMSDVRSALTSASINATKLVFAQGSLGNDGVPGGSGDNEDQITHEGIFDLSGSGGNTDGGSVLNKEPSGSIAITGTITQGEVLTADASSVADEDGLGEFNYQWFAGDVAITDATESTLTLSQAEVGKAITAKVSYTDGYGASEELTSSASGDVVNVNDAPVFQYQIDAFSFNIYTDDDESVDNEIVFDASSTLSFKGAEDANVKFSYVDLDDYLDTNVQLETSGIDPNSIAYNGVGIDFDASDSVFASSFVADSSVYNLFAIGGDGFVETALPGRIVFSFDENPMIVKTQEDFDHFIAFAMSTDELRIQSLEPETSYLFSELPNVEVVHPITISGLLTVGSELNAAVADWIDPDGTGSSTFDYQWLRDGTDISGAAASTYTLAQADVGAAISIRTSYTDGGGTAEGVTSAATQTIISSAPTVAPFDIVLASESGGVATFEIYADASVDPESDGFGSLDMVISHDPTDMLIDMSTFTGADPLTGIPNYKLADGELIYGAFALSGGDFTDLSSPIATFDATILVADNPIDITLSGLRVESVSHSNVSETFDLFSSGDVLTSSGDLIA
jgi:hypothetical protein